MRSYPYGHFCATANNSSSHFNAIDKFADGDFLVSSREIDTIFKISHIDGSIVWRLGGPKSDFRLHDKAKFGAQHLVRKSQLLGRFTFAIH